MITSRTVLAASRRRPPFRRPATSNRMSSLVFAVASLLLAALIGLVVVSPAPGHHRPGHGGGSGGGGGGASGNWTRTGDPIFNEGAADGRGTTMADGRVLLAGNGRTNAEIYDSATGRWRATASMPDARTNNVIVGLRDGRVLVANGDDYIFGTPTSAWLFDPTTETWSATGSPLATRRIAIGALLNDGRVLVVGEPPGPGFPFAEVYDPATGTWSATGPMVSPRTPDTATTLLDGRVLVVGNELHGPELYDPVSNSWATAASLQTPRASHRAARLADGRVLVAGGFADRFGVDALDRVEIYDPAANTWTPAANLNVARTFGHSATTLADGRVLVAGGGDERLPLGEQYLASAELYNPATNTWTMTRSMTVERLSHFAVLLTNGKVLAAGGADNEDIRTGNGIAGETAELFTP